MTGPGAGARTFEALRNPSMRAVVTSETLSSLGSQLTFVALPWFVLVTTGSPSRMGVVLAAELVPIALLGLPSALLVHRVGVRRTLIACDAARAPVIAAVPALSALGLLSFPALLAVVVLSGVFSAPYFTAQRLLLPETFADDETLVVQGNALLEAGTRFAALLGPAVAGVLIAAFGTARVLYLDAVSFAVSAVVLAAGLPRRTTGPAGPPEPSGGVLAGARFVLGDRLLRTVSAAALVFGLVFPMLMASVPVLAQRRFDGDPKVAGLLFSAWGAGALLGSYLVLRVADRLPAMRLGALAAVGLTVPLWFAPLDLGRWGFAAVLLVSGVFVPVLNAPVITVIMLRTPTQFRAQVMAFVLTANLLSGPLGYVIAGRALDVWGFGPLLTAVAVGSTVATALLFTVRE